jgi:hypothetical protein
MDINQLLPQKTECFQKAENHEHVNHAFKAMQDAVFTVENAFFDIYSDFQRDQIKRFMCSKLLLEAEEAIEKQYQSALSGNENAAQNVVTGMQYWKKLVTKEIDKFREVASR